jgi:hypothetical protein
VAAVLRADGSFLVEISADLDALLLGAGSGHDSAVLAARVAAMGEKELEDGLERLRGLFQRRIRVRFDGEATPFGVSFPDRQPAMTSESEPPSSVLGLRARLAGRAPENWSELTFWASRAFQQVRWTVVQLESGRSDAKDLEVGEESPPFRRIAASSD